MRKMDMRTWVFCAVAFWGCTQNEEMDDCGEKVPLSINVDIEGKTARASIEGTFPEGSQIGIQVAEKGKKTYNNRNYSNIKTTATQQDGVQKWILASKTYLSATEAVVTAYYPYNKNVDMTAIPVETASQTDYMYATPVYGVDNYTHTATLTMKHMLTKVRMSFVKGALKNDKAEITEISVSGNCIATRGTFDATQKEPGFVSFSGREEEIQAEETSILGDDGVEMLVIPSGEMGKIHFKVKVDGEICEVDEETEALQSGYAYHYKFVVNEAHIILEQVQVRQWGENELGESTIR